VYMCICVRVCMCIKFVCVYVSIGYVCVYVCMSSSM